MPSRSEWREVEQGMGRDAFKLEAEATRQSGSMRMIIAVWLTFYIFAVTHSLWSQHEAAPVATAEVQAPSKSLTETRDRNIVSRTSFRLFNS